MNKISRRKLIQRLAILPFPLTSGFWSKNSFAAVNPDIFFLTIQTNGAWDVTVFCDPKENTAGEKEITTWSKKDETREIGNLKYAPFAKNKEFFEKYYNDMLVVNGVDAQTNSHTVGVTNNWSGRTAAGYPSLPTLFSSVYGTNYPLPYISFGGAYSYTANQVSPAIIGNPASIKELLLPNINGWDGNKKVDSTLWKLIQAENIASIQAASEKSMNFESQKRRLEYIEAFGNSEKLATLGYKLPESNELNILPALQQQIITALSAFSANTTITADISHNGYDTHENNDNQQAQLLSELVTAIDFMWEQAEILGIADKLFVMIGSDFGRTPYYNANKGKDHWNVGSYIFMKKNASFTNQVIGKTDALHNAMGLSSKILQPDDSSETIKPIHVHSAVRDYLGVIGTKVDLMFPLGPHNKYNIFG
jgi:hypothetical protein